MRVLSRRPFVILLSSLGLILLLFVLRRSPEERIEQVAAPLVRIVVASPTSHRLVVTAHGEVSPRTESDLIPQVSGEVVWVSPSLVSGGFFEAGEVLARIDAADYHVERQAARAAVTRAESTFQRAEKELLRQRQLAESSVTSEARIDDAENEFKVAEADLHEMKAKLERAERDHARTSIPAPYRGRVRSESVDVGQFVNRGTPIARIYAIEYAEVRLPLPDRELAYLDVPLTPVEEAIAAEGAAPFPPSKIAPRAQSKSGASNPSTSTGARVRLTAEFAGASHVWEGRLVRTEGELDPRSRMIHVVARVEDPYGLETTRSAPLAVGLFVDAEIEGVLLEKVFVLPREALREGDQVFTVDAEDRLRMKEVEVLRTEREQVVVGRGLEPGERICTSPLQAAIEGMSVRVAADAMADASPSEAPR